ncbi:DUF2218 domain-containing protein [Nonomuraea sp. NPDC050556]|uniref:DUF2218 domain-containing protein n=1 Tax=Nonomuraea sp. NPDC050556 TaxID=3364369 RepID=UPI0037B0413F
MIDSTAQVDTPRAERYIKQLVSHMGHKVSTKLDDDGLGTITLSYGECTLTPFPGHILLRATAEDLDKLADVQDVVARHLVRFASQEELTVTWTS